MSKLIERVCVLLFETIYSVGGKSVSIKANGGGLGACTGLISEPVNDSAAAQARPCEWDDKGVPIKAISVADQRKDLSDGKIQEETR